MGRFHPNSKTCCHCKNTKKDLELKDRIYHRLSCGVSLDRDKNAAINIKSFALRNILSGTDRKNQGKLPTLVGELTLEAHPIASGVGG